MTTHFGRSFADHHLEDECPCPQTACGLVADDNLSTECTQHPMEHFKTIRQLHKAEDCPELPKTLAREVDRAYEKFCMELDAIAQTYKQTSDKWLPIVDDAAGEQPAYAEWVAETWEFEATA